MRVLFVSRGKSDNQVPPIIKSQGISLIDKGIDLEFFTIKGGGITGYLKSIFEIRKKIKGNIYNLVHVHYGVSGIAVLLSFTKTPKILSLMGDDLLGAKRKDGSISMEGKILTYIIKFSIKFFDALIVKSNEMAGKIEKYNPLILPNGVSFDRFKPINKKKARQQLNIKTDKKIILFPANKNRVEKNYSLFKAAFESINDYDLEEISFKDIPHERTIYYFNSADVVVLTSLHEGSPNVIKEAMACNIPIVSTDVGDVREVTCDTNGCFISKFDPIDVANNMKMALNFDKRTNGRKNIKHLESGVIAEKIIELYYKTMSK